MFKQYFCFIFSGVVLGSVPFAFVSTLSLSKNIFIASIVTLIIPAILLYLTICFFRIGKKLAIGQDVSIKYHILLYSIFLLSPFLYGVYESTQNSPYDYGMYDPAPSSGMIIRTY